MNRVRTRDVLLAVAIAAGFFVHAIGADWSALSGRGHVILALLGLAGAKIGDARSQCRRR